MTSYIGIDIIEIDRIEKAAARWGEHFLRRIYTDRELDQCGSRPESLAARFAAKEAVMKILKKGRDTIGWRDIEITSGPDGEPRLKLYGQARDKAKTLALTDLAISLSHSRNMAVASALGASNDNKS